MRGKKRKDIGLASSENGEGEDPLRAEPQKPEEEFMHSLETNNYEYVVGLATSANLVSGRFGALNVDYTLEERRTDLFFRRKSTRYRRRSPPLLLYSKACGL